MTNVFSDWIKLKWLMFFFMNLIESFLIENCYSDLEGGTGG